MAPALALMEEEFILDIGFALKAIELQGSKVGAVKVRFVALSSNLADDDTAPFVAEEVSSGSDTVRCTTLATSSMHAFNII